MKPKRLFTLIFSLCFFVFTLSACNPKSNEGTIPSPPGQTAPNQSDEPKKPSKPDKQETPSEPSKPDEQEMPSEPGDSKPGDTLETKKAYSLSEDGKTVCFGSYPQAQVTESNLIGELNALSETEEWSPYHYYIGGEVSEFMRYVDVEYRSNRYRGVRFSSYRPNDTRSEGTENHSYQDENGYTLNETYWFLYETLSWRVLERLDEFALIVSEKVVDGHEFFPAAKGEDGKKANDYGASSIRAFLNGTFYETAFSEQEQTNLFGDDDKVFLLSYEDVTNAAYFPSDKERALGATDYAKLQGLNMSGGARWWLRSANDTYDFYARYVDGYGYPEYNQYVYWCSIGVVPALRIKLYDETTPPTETEQDKPDQKEEEVKNEIFLSINGHKISVKLEQNEATKALVELLKEGDITYTAHDYGGFEKVGSLGHTLPREDKQMTTETGDVILYSGNQIVLFYGSNSWSYTKLGKVQDISAEEWREILTESNSITVTISLQ